MWSASVSSISVPTSSVVATRGVVSVRICVARVAGTNARAAARHVIAPTGRGWWRSSCRRPARGRGRTSRASRAGPRGRTPLWVREVGQRPGVVDVGREVLPVARVGGHVRVERRVVGLRRPVALGDHRAGDEADRLGVEDLAGRVVGAVRVALRHAVEGERADVAPEVGVHRRPGRGRGCRGPRRPSPSRGRSAPPSARAGSGRPGRSAIAVALDDPARGELGDRLLSRRAGGHVGEAGARGEGGDDGAVLVTGRFSGLPKPTNWPSTVQPRKRLPAPRASR